jgi:glycosyltransferase involved in cell wall biosynthesis
MQLTSESAGRDAASKPTVTVIITYYNQVRFIRDTVLSVRRQSYQHLEIIVVDDGSTEPVESILADIAGIAIFRTENKGCPAARNFGFLHSNGEYLIFLDGDDLLLPDAVAAQLETLRSRPDAVLVFGAARFINECGDEIPSPRLCRPRHDYFLMLLECNPIACPGAAMIKRNPFIEVGLFDESFFVVEDYDLYLRMLKKAPAARNPQSVVLYRRHGDNLSRDLSRMQDFVCRALDKLESSATLTRSTRRRLQRGRKRWIHTFCPKPTLRYRLVSLYFKFRAMLTVSPRSYLGRAHQ